MHPKFATKKHIKKKQTSHKIFLSLYFVSYKNKLHERAVYKEKARHKPRPGCFHNGMILIVI